MSSSPWSGWLPRRLLPGLLAAWLALASTAPRAWDADAMVRAAEQQGPRAVAGVRALQGVLASLSGADDTAKLQGVNRFFNQRIAFATDEQVWGQVDYWASPIEMLEKGRGDCEDYVIGKYYALVAAGMPVSRLRLVYVRAFVGNQWLAHMVLAYYAAPGAEPLVMDNLVQDIRPAQLRPDLQPVFSFNSEGLWQGVGAQRAGDPYSRLSRWREVAAKARAEGFE